MTIKKSPLRIKYESWQLRLFRMFNLQRDYDQVVEIDSLTYCQLLSETKDLFDFGNNRFYPDVYVDLEKQPYHFLFRVVRSTKQEEMGYAIGYIEADENDNARVVAAIYPGDGTLAYVLLIPLLLPFVCLFLATSCQILNNLNNLSSIVGLIWGLGGFSTLLCIFFWVSLFSDRNDVYKEFAERNNQIKNME